MDKRKTTTKKTESVARHDDGTLEINLSIDWADIERGMETTAKKMGQDVMVPGFRKGKAPVEQLLKHFSKDELTENTIKRMLPLLYNEAVKKHNLRPIMYPKFEIVKAVEGEDWQIRVKTCEMPKIELGDYKKEIRGAISAGTIWTPEKGISEADKDKKEISREEREQLAIDALLNSVKFEIPSILTDEEVNSRLANLLERIEKLGLSLDTYLGSINKTPDTLREEYRQAAERTIKLDMLLGIIANEENIDVTEEEIKAFIEASRADPKLAHELESEEKKAIIKTIIKKRKVIEMLSSL